VDKMELIETLIGVIITLLIIYFTYLIEGKGFLTVVKYALLSFTFYVISLNMSNVNYSQIFMILSAVSILIIPLEIILMYVEKIYGDKQNSDKNE
jgi:hypothetical protein